MVGSRVQRRHERLLDHVVGRGVVLDKGARETSHPSRVGEQVFGSGGAERLGQTHGFPVLGQVPIDPGVRVGGDDGEPIVSAKGDGESASADALREVAGRLAQRLAVKAFSSLPILD